MTSPAAGPLPNKVRRVGAPIAAIIALGTLTALLLVVITASNPAGAILGFVLTTMAMAVVVGCYLWLDRWEPEPPRLLIMAFLWGASVAVVISIVLELVFDATLRAGAGPDATSSPLTIAVGAPLIEEAAKGLFLLIMMTGRRRHELNSLTDCLVFAGLTAAGFAWIEDIFYIASGENMATSLVTAALRLVMAPFAHPLFTTFIGIGVYLALHRRSLLAKAGCILAGYLAAVVMHGLWNGSALFGTQVYFGLYVVWMVPIFVAAIVLALYGRRREQQIVATKLPGMLAAGLISPSEATWLDSMRTRKLAIAAARRVGPPGAHGDVKTFATQVVKLAFAQDRLDRGFADPWAVALRDEETHRLYAVRQSAGPILARLQGYPAR